MEKENILEIKNLTIEFRLKHTTIHPVSNVNLSVKEEKLELLLENLEAENP